MDLTSPEAMDGSAQSRLDAWAYARALAADYPISGGGFETFTEELFTRYWPSRVGTIYGPHSIYFQVLAEHGYVGLSLYLMLMAVCLTTTWRLTRAARARSDHTVFQYAQMFQLSLIGFLVSGAFLGRAYFDYVFTVIACIAIVRKLAHEKWAASDLGQVRAGMAAQAIVTTPDGILARPPLSPVGGR